jgi:hypothetical protein
MRIKLNFLPSDQNFQEFYEKLKNENLNKIIFPINLNETVYVKDLKKKIEIFLNRKFEEFNLGRIKVELLMLELFGLLDEFEVREVLNDNDEIK